MHALQLVDDMLDYTGSATALGKPALNDLRSGLATAPVLYAAELHPELRPMILRKFEVGFRGACASALQTRVMCLCQACTPLELQASTASCMQSHAADQLHWAHGLVAQPRSLQPCTWLQAPGDVERAQQLVFGCDAIERTRQLAIQHAQQAAAAVRPGAPAWPALACPAPAQRSSSLIMRA